MKRFLKQIVVSAFGVLLALFLVIILISFFANMSDKPLAIKDKTILELSLTGTIVEHTTEKRLYNKEENISLLDLKKAIQQGKNDPRVAGIYLQIGWLQVGWATLEELRKELVTFKKSGKFVISYGENYTQKGYYLAALADETVIHPSGVFGFQGLSATQFFYKGLLEKLAIKPIIFRVGTYKSFVEPYLLDSMSAANKMQTSAYIDSIYNYYVQQLHADRNICPQLLKKMANELSVVLPQDACKATLFSKVGYEYDVIQLIKNKLGFAAKDCINKVPFKKYIGSSNQQVATSSTIAVVIASGEIIDGRSRDSNVMSSGHFSAIMKKIREDATIKSVVLRINSPGGSALAANVMWREIELTKAVKPVVASMSDVAASGGYYIAAPCNYIFAHPTTITGSIGVFGLFFDPNQLFNNCGITRDGVKTSQSADLLNPRTTITAAEKKVIQRTVNATYDTFLEKVSQGRQLSIDALGKLAEGRVYTGIMAQENGLVDALGGLSEAITMAAKLGNIDQNSCTICYWPRKKTFVETLFYNFDKEVVAYCLNKVAAQYPYIKSWEQLKRLQGIQARSPHVVVE